MGVDLEHSIHRENVPSPPYRHEPSISCAKKGIRAAFFRGNRSRVKRIVALALLLLASPAAADEEEEATESDSPAEELDPDAGVARPDADDLRHGHLLLGVSGGVWVPSNPFTPDVDGLGSLDAGGTVHGRIGIGLGRYLALNLDGGFAHVPATNTLSCDSCGVTSIDVGPSLAFHLAQGFALDPWVSYGVSYRNSMLTLPTADDSISAFDFMRLALGADYYPTGVFGFGPYIETDVGVRDFDNTVFYAIFHAGLRLTLDPFQSGTSFTPGVASLF
jgi:hypothetical protein